MVDEDKSGSKNCDVKTLEPQRFEIGGDSGGVGDPRNWLTHLEEHGYAVLRDPSFGAEQILAATRLFWDYVEAVSGNAVQRDDPRSWSDAHWPATLAIGIFRLHGVGQSAFMWYVRTLPVMRRVFEAYYSGERDFCTSFDGCGAFRGAEHPMESREWPHVDQNLATHPIYGSQIQALANFFESSPATGGFVCVPGSHRRVTANFGRRDPATMRMFADPRLSARHLTSETAARVFLRLLPGDVLVWHSTLIHENRAPPRATVSTPLSTSSPPPVSPPPSLPPPPLQEAMRGRLIRLVAYVSYQPRDQVLANELLGYSGSGNGDSKTSPAKDDAENTPAAAFKAKRRAACAAGWTCGHLVHFDLRDNRPGLVAEAEAKTKTVTFACPETCRKREFTEAEELLL